MTLDSLELLRLRVVVLALGEAPHAAWWKSQFLSPVGLRHLDRLYPRSKFAAAVRSAGEAARLVHDASIGVGQVYHLFRLPLDEERRLEAALREDDRGLEDDLAPILGSREALLAQLEQLAGGKTAEASAGPREVGKLRDWRAGRLTSQVAAWYSAAFRGDVRIYPYIQANGKPA